MNQPLHRLKVLDLSHQVAGPYCTKLLADFGADVIKVERPGVGDVARTMGPFPGDLPDPEASGTFLFLNTNKRSVTLDLAKGRATAEQLVRWADVVVENFRDGTLERLGLGYAQLAAWNPRVVLTSISNFGKSGPYREWRAEDIVLYAMGGSMNLTGAPSREPLRLALNLMQIQGGNLAAGATLGAYRLAKRTGAGQLVEVPLFETQVGGPDRRIQNLLSWEYTKEEVGREEGFQTALPMGFLPCQDGYVQIQVQTYQFPLWAEMLGHPELAKEPRFARAETFMDPAVKDELDLILYPWLLEHTKAEILALAQRYGLPSGALNTIADVLQSPQFRERGFWETVTHPRAGALTHPGAPLHLEDGWKIRRPAPLLGQHNHEVYGGMLGYSRQDLTNLRQLRII
jgi:crotonobetainyl-CoA:carnitine CoA-transferase CaiB-like acyl-CoA transferase